MRVKTNYEIDMEQPDQMGQGGGLYAVANVSIRFYLGEDVDQEKIDSAFEDTKLNLLYIDSNWRNHEFNRIVDFLREECRRSGYLGHKYGRAAAEIERMEKKKLEG